MILIGEKLNSSVPSSFKAIDEENRENLISVIKAQAECGADYIDINTALFGAKEFEKLKMLISLCIENSNCGIMVDSPDENILYNSFSLCKGRSIFVNSVTSSERIDRLKDIIAQYDAKTVVLPISENGIPETAEEMCRNAEKALKTLSLAGVSEENIYFDALITSVSSGKSAKESLEFMDIFKGKTICGLSNISFGLPKRQNLNSAFLAMAISHGAGALILDICKKETKDILLASNAIMGIDEFGIEYLNHIRNS